MGVTHRKIFGLVILAIVAASSVQGRPPADEVQKPQSAPEKSVKEEGPSSEVKVEAAKLEVSEVKKPLPGDETAFIASLPSSLPSEKNPVREVKDDVQRLRADTPNPADAVQVPVVIADMPIPEAMVVIPETVPRGRILATRMARMSSGPEARDAEGSDGSIANTFPSSYYDAASITDPSIIALEQAKRLIMTRTLPRIQEDPTTLGEEENVAKKVRRHRVLFRDDPNEERKIDARGPHISFEARNSPRKMVDTESALLNRPIQSAPIAHTYEVREPGRETIILARPTSIQDSEVIQPPKLQLIRHIHHQQFVVPYNPSQQYFNWSPQMASDRSATPYQQSNNKDGGSEPLPVQPVASVIPPSPPTSSTHRNQLGNQPLSFFLNGQQSPSAYNIQASDKPGSVPYIVGNSGFSPYGAGLTQSITNIFEYGEAPSTCTERKEAKSTRRKREVRTITDYSTPAVTTTEIPLETTMLPELPELREVGGNLAGPVIQSISSEDEDEEKEPTTIVLGGGDDPGSDDDEDDDESSQSETALDDEDDDEDEESEEQEAPTAGSSGINKRPVKATFQKKLKDRLDKIEKNIRKRVKNTQQGLHGLKKQVNRHVTEIVMQSEGGLEEAGPVVSKLVVRRGGVAIAGPGGIATAGFGGTAIVGPGGTAYTSPDSLAVAGPGARVISVPSSKLQAMFDSFRKANGRGIEAFKPSWLGTIPPDGKLVATGPVVFFNPPEQVASGITVA